jgi:D-alanine-D-alanine ligase
MRRSMHKLEAKAVLSAAGVPTPAWLERGMLVRLASQNSGESELPGRWIVKSVTEHASAGLDEDSVLGPISAAGLLAALDARVARHGGEWFAEGYVEGREFNIALLDGPSGPQVLPPAEMVFTGWDEGRPRVLGFAAKWAEHTAEYQSTVRSFDFPPEDAPLLGRLSTAARACWHAFGLSGYARVDFRVDQDGLPLVIDVNANPCLSPDAGFAAALARAGIPFARAVERILAAGLAQK